MSREHSTKKCPCSPERVRCYLQAGRFQEAQEHYTAGLALEPRSTSLLCNRARTRLREAQPVEVRAQPPWTLRTTAFSVKRAVAAACGCVLKALRRARKCQAMEDASRAMECLCAPISETQRHADETWAAALTKALYLQACGPRRVAVVANSHTRTRRDSCA